MHHPPFTLGHRPGAPDSSLDVSLAHASPPQLAAELRVQQLRTLFSILVTVDGFSEAALLYRHAIVRAGRADQ